MSDLNIVDIDEAMINTIKSTATGLYDKLTSELNVYNNFFTAKDVAGISTAKETCLRTINSIDENVIDKLKNIDNTIISSTSSLKSNIDILISQMSNPNKNDDSRSSILKNNFKDLYNKQYLTNSHLFAGILILGIVVSKSLFYEIK
jgi:hypothetical protein